MGINAFELAYVRLQVPDFDEAERFYTSFGLPTRLRTADRLYVRGTGPEHHLIVAHQGERGLVAVAFEVSGEADLERASQLPGASAIQPIEGPGGGRMVVLTDPDGNRLELVHGIEQTAPLGVPPQHFNFAAERHRRRNVFVRPAKGPSRVLRLGHVVLRTPDVTKMRNWYHDVIGLLDSDDVPSPDGDGLLMSFVRLNQGEVPVDHHVMQFLKGGKNELHHISFEVQDIDDLHVGHEALRAAGYEHMWGIGRHIQGSQIFDYWRDPFGVMYEHWTDSDRLDASVAKGVSNVEDMESPWGPDMPEGFILQGTL